MIVSFIFVLALTDYKFSFNPVNAAHLHQSPFNEVRGKHKRSTDNKGCQIPPPLKNGAYSPSQKRCPTRSTSSYCQMTPGATVPGTSLEQSWPLYYECNPGYMLNTPSGESFQHKASICRNAHWLPPLPSCVESRYESLELPHFLSPLSYCGRPVKHTRTKRKILGSVSKKGAWPWLAIFGMRKNNTQNGDIHWFCAGTLVTTRHILTAAHCLADYRKRNAFFARFNDIDLDKTSDDEGVLDIEIKRSNIVINPGFKKEAEFSHNIAIVKLDSDLPITDFIRPVCLPTPDFTGKSFDDTVVHFTSWGQTDNDREWSRKRHYQPILQEVQATVVNHATCNYNYRNYQSDDFVIIGWDLICASVPTNKSCQGDAGSPLMLNVKDTYVLVGVVATPFRCYDEQFPRLFTRLSVYMDWIIANIKI